MRINLADNFCNLGESGTLRGVELVTFNIKRSVAKIRTDNPSIKCQVIIARRGSLPFEKMSRSSIQE